MADDVSDETKWPGVEQAYNFVIPSYEWMQQRLDAVHGHIQAIQAFAATVIVAAPVLAAAVVKDIDLGSTWFLSAMAVFVSLVVSGTVARAFGAIQLLSPKKLHDRWLHYHPWEFKKNAVYFAGEHWNSNKTLIDRKGWCANLMTLAFIAQVGLLVAWVWTER